MKQKHPLYGNIFKDNNENKFVFLSSKIEKMIPATFPNDQIVRVLEVELYSLADDFKITKHLKLRQEDSIVDFKVEEKALLEEGLVNTNEIFDETLDLIDLLPKKKRFSWFGF